MEWVNMSSYPTVRDRKIRLKEWGINYTFDAEITSKHLEGFDGSMKEGFAHVSTDNNGFIKTENDLDPRGRKPILVIGASFVESMFVQPQNRFCAVLESELDRISPGKFSVWNAGYSAMTPVHMLNKFVASLRPLFSRLAGVILSVPTVDQGIIGRKYSYWDPDKIVSPVLPVVEGVEFPAEAFDGWKDQAVLWGAIIRFLRDYDVPVAVAGTPFRRSTWDEDLFWKKTFQSAAQPEGVIAYLDRIVDSAISVSRGANAPIIDARKFPSMASPNHRYFYDLLHLNNEGGPAFGRDLARHLTAIRVFD